MSSPTPDWTAVVERLEKLERQNRRLKQMGAVALLIAAAVLLMGQASPNRTVEANEFVLRDGNGKVRGTFSMADLGPQLALLDANGIQRVNLLLTVRTPSLFLSDANGQNRVALQVSETGPFLDFYRTDGELAAWFLGPDEGGLIGLRAPNGDRRLLLRVSEDGPAVELYNNERVGANEARVALDGTAGQARLVLSDAEGFNTVVGTTDLITPRTGETHKTSAASVVLFDKDKKVLWKAP